MTLQKHEAMGDRLGRVLVVDDEDAIRKVAVRSLTKAGYEVVEADNGESAITALNSDDNPLMVDAILCDIHMPKINGHEAIAYFRRQYPSVPVVVLTGYPEVDRAVALMKAGVADYLVKPISKEDLVSVIARAVESHDILKDQFAV